MYSRRRFLGALGIPVAAATAGAALNLEGVAHALGALRERSREHTRLRRRPRG